MINGYNMMQWIRFVLKWEVLVNIGDIMVTGGDSMKLMDFVCCEMCFRWVIYIYNRYTFNLTNTYGNIMS